MFISGSNYSKNNLSFGWYGSTHQEVCRKLIRKYNRLFPEKAMQFDDDMLVKIGSISPDLDRKKIVQHIHGHFVDINNLSKDPPDAYHLAMQYTNKAMAANKAGKYGKRDLYIGYASHFIADALQPFHSVGFEYQSKNNPIRIAHKHFEQLAEKLHDIAFKETTINDLEEPLTSSFFSDVFPNAIKKAQQYYKRLSVTSVSSDDNPASIAISALDNTYKTMNIYFKMLLSKFLN